MAFVAKTLWPSIFFHLFLVLSATCSVASASDILRNLKSNTTSFKAVFVFGDSTVDPGNNNDLKTIFKSNYPPYGVDYPGQIPTGRFCNGRLPTDFIASYSGIKQNIPAYLDSSTLSLEDLITGVSFASAGSGYDPLTPAKTNVINMATQLKYFDQYLKTIESKIGKNWMKVFMKHSVFIISCGTNDIIYTYGVVETPIDSYTVPTYLHFMLGQSKWFIQDLIDRGALNIAVVGLPPVGCLPAVITVHAVDKPRTCVESLSAMARDYNQMLQDELKALQASQPKRKIIYADIYTPLEDQINHPKKYGFLEVDKGCCGTGLLESGFTCNSLSSVCDDRSKYLFWDSIHPSERSYEFIFEALHPVVDYLLHYM